MLRIVGVLAVFMLSIGNAAAGPSAPPIPWDVNIINTPIPVQVAGPSREPIELAGYATPTANYGGTCIVDLYQVPAGKRLVVEWASAKTFIDAVSTGMPFAYFGTGAAVYNDLTSQNIAASYDLIPTRLAGAAGLDSVIIGQPLRLYVAAGNTLQFVWSYGAITLPTRPCWVNVSGYLEAI